MYGLAIAFLHNIYSIAKQGNFVVTKYPKNQGGAVPCDPDLGQPLCVWLYNRTTLPCLTILSHFHHSEEDPIFCVSKKMLPLSM